MEPGRNCTMANLTSVNCTAGNVTTAPPLPSLPLIFGTAFPENVPQVGYLLLVLILCLLGNTAVIGTVWLDERLHEPPNFLLSGLCVADILYDLLIVPVMLNVLLTRHYTFGQTACDIMAFFHILCTFFSMMMTGAISFERYHFICHPMQYHSKFTGRRIWGLLLVCLTGATLTACCMLPFLRSEPPFFYPAPMYCVSHAILSGVVGWLFFMAAGSLATYSQVRIYLEARRHLRAIQAGNISGHSAEDFRKKIKSAVTTTAVVAIWWLSEFPLITVETILVTAPHVTSVSWQVAHRVSRFAYFISTCSNPIVFAFRNRRFRQAFKKLLRPQAVHSFN